MLGGLIGAVRDALGIGMRLRIESAPRANVVVLIDTERWPPAEIDGTTVRLQYDASRPVTDNGRELAGLLTDLVAGWPVEIERLTLIGQSTGGLLAQHAVNAATWSGIETRVICFTTSYADEPALHAWSLRTPTRPSSIQQIPCLDERDWLPVDPTRALSHPAPPALPAPAPSTRPGHWIGDLLVLPYQPPRRWRAWLRRLVSTRTR